MPVVSLKYLFFMKKILLVLFFVPVFGIAQSDILILQKNGANVKTYEPGMYFIIETIYNQWLEGTITAIKNDSIFINNFPFHYKEIKTVRNERTKLNYTTDGVLLMIAGGGVLLLGAVNGLYRGDQAKDWYTTASFVTAGTLLIGGYLLTRSRFKKYHLGKKYTLEYFILNPNKK